MAIVNLALEEPDLSPRELAVNFTDMIGSFVSEASVYRLLKDHGLITSPAFILMKAADRFADPTTAPNQLWQTDFTYLKVIGWGWFYLSTVLDDFSRYILAWKLCTTMAAIGYVTGGAAGVRSGPGQGPASAAAIER
jgi:putative transposase